MGQSESQDPPEPWQVSLESWRVPLELRWVPLELRWRWVPLEPVPPLARRFPSFRVLPFQVPLPLLWVLPASWRHHQGRESARQQPQQQALRLRQAQIPRP